MKMQFAILALLLAASCRPQPEKQPLSSAVRRQSKPVTRAEAVQIAGAASRKAMLIQKQVNPQVEESDTAFVVTYPMTESKKQLVRGPDYYTKVTIDRQTGKITKLLVAP